MGHKPRTLNTQLYNRKLDTNSSGTRAFRHYQRSSIHLSMPVYFRTKFNFHSPILASRPPPHLPPSPSPFPPPAPSWPGLHPPPFDRSC